MSEQVATPRTTFGPERLNALTDGVFAIILTLLVLELKAPELAAGDDVLGLLADNRHVFAAWIISFVAIARFWMVHHTVSSTMTSAQTATIVLTFVFLCAATLMPFTADTLGNTRIAEPWSTVLFAVNFALVSLALGLLALHAERKAKAANTNHPALGLAKRHHLVVLPIVAMVAAFLAFAHPYMALALLTLEFLAVAWWGLFGPGTKFDWSPRRRIEEDQVEQDETV